ncbi:NfeD family protein [Roseibium limicola]|uniref:NfeD family protein n=1 Tax=Roseibium limicola TaxID=2816037 RepID=A0A939ER03_9HYPH|nr:NfeD family protein [Roseibium limicola]MBO0346992.1 NfeD family protein [Roseibium limicola]
MDSVILDQIRALGPWAWWVLGLLLLGLEIVAPGTLFLWFGIAAILVGAVALVIDMSWQVALILYVVLAFASFFLGRGLISRLKSEEGDPQLNKRGSRYIGRVFTLASPLHQGSGNLSIDDTVWRVSGPDLPAGVNVRVERIEGAHLVVAPVEDETASTN